MTDHRTTRVKKSYSISPESECYIRTVRKTRKIASDSQALDQILLEAQQAQKLAAINEAYQRYYDTASDEELAEERGWAALGEAALAALPL
jgi:hypothetical protein